MTSVPRPGKWIRGLNGRTPLVEAARTILDAHLSAVAELLPLAQKHHEEDPEFIHQLRVATRRADAAMRAFRSCCQARRWRKLRRRLRRIRRAAGEARTADVHIMMLADRLEIAGNDSLAAISHVLDRTRQQRLAVQQDVDKTAKRYPPQKLHQSIEKLLNSLSRPKDAAPKPTMLGAALDRLSAELVRVESAAAADMTAFENLHALRLKSKRLRYAMEVFASCFDKRLREELYPQMQVLQDHLGGINDAHEMAMRFDRFADELDGDDILRNELRRMAETCRGKREALRDQFLAWWRPFRTDGALAGLRQLLDETAATKRPRSSSTIGSDSDAQSP